MADFFADYDDTWVDTDDDSWYPLDAVPINALSVILQSIGQGGVRLQPTEILALSAVIRNISQFASVTEVTNYITITAINAVLRTLGKKHDLPFGSIAWAWGESPTELMRHFGGGYYMGPFEPGWSGTGQVLNSEAFEHLSLDPGEYMDSHSWNVGVGKAKVNLDKYSRKAIQGPVTKRFRTGLTKTQCESALWNSLEEGRTFTSLGYVQLRLGSTTVAGITEGAFYDHGGFDWEDDGGFNWE